ncbi:MAG: hypothetical protein LBK23_07505 [Oscillospiraceae bacterium]|jgi:hypothetical protein|nr:hypothetical protein [Oscillospiraceae bacterium]
MPKNKAILEDYRVNINRVKNLIDTFHAIPKKPGPVKATDVDILRASVVFLHAAFEYYYRQVVIDGIIHQLKNHKTTDLDRLKLAVPIKDLYTAPAGDLSAALDNAVIEELKKQSFNSYGQIKTHAKQAGLDIDSFTKGKELDEMIQRRHVIVHHADNCNGGANSKNKLTDDIVENWLAAVDELVALIEKNNI